MTEEITEPSEEQVEAVETEQSTEPATETLDDVIKKYNVEEQANQFAASQPQQTQYQQPESFDYDTTKPLFDRLEKLEQDILKERVEADVQKAVAKVNEKANLDPTITEVFLEKKYREDPQFKRIWDARASNPKALDAALKVIANEASSLFQVRTDAQLVENQRAAKTSQRTMATAPEEDSLEAKAMKMSNGEFDRLWESLKGH